MVGATYDPGTVAAIRLSANIADDIARHQAVRSLADYIELCTKIRADLRYTFALNEVDTLILTESYWRLVAVQGAAHDMNLIWPLVQLESKALAERLRELASSIEVEIDRWDACEVIFVPDTNVFLHTLEGSIAEEDWREHSDVGPYDSLTVAVLGVVLGELDRNKRIDKTKKRAREALREIRDTLGSRPSAQAEISKPTRDTASVFLTSVMEDLRHVELPVADNEIIDRALTLAGRSGARVVLLTGDQKMAFSAGAAGLECLQVETPD